VLTDKLERALQGTSVKPIGFGAVATKARAPQMLLLAALPKASADLVPQLATARADGVMLSAAPESKFIAAAKEKGLAWGVHASATSASEAQALKGAGCDFVVYGVESPASLFDETGIGQVLEIDAGIEATLAAGLERLVPSAIYLPLDDTPFVSVRRVLQCQRLARMSRKPLLAQVHPSVSGSELAALCDAGVAGIVVEARGAEGGATLTRLHEAIAALPPRGTRAQAPKTQAVLPRLHLTPTGADEGEPPDEPDEGE
jgi:hypothetical protein